MSVPTWGKESNTTRPSRPQLLSIEVDRTNDASIPCMGHADTCNKSVPSRHPDTQRAMSEQHWRAVTMFPGADLGLPHAVLVKANAFQNGCAQDLLALNVHPER
eukprot:8470444-Alexandrium_andersonii.AAC.1